MYREHPHSAELDKLRQLLQQKDAIIEAQARQIEHVQGELDNRPGDELEELGQSVMDLEQKWSIEKEHVRKLSDLVSEKDQLVNEMSSRLKEKNALIEKMQEEQRGTVKREEVESLRMRLVELERENRKLNEQNTELEMQNDELETLRRESQSDLERLTGQLENLKSKMRSDIEDREKGFREEERKVKELTRVLANKDKEFELNLGQLQQQADMRMSRMKRTEMDLEEEIQNLKHEVEQLDKIIDEKDQVIMDLRRKARHARMAEEKQWERNAPNEDWRERPPKSRAGVEDHYEEEYQSTFTMMSLNPKRAEMSAQRRRQSEVEGQNRRLEKEMEELRRENDELGRRLSEERDEVGKWRKRFGDLESQYKDLTGRFDTFTERHSKQKGQLEVTAEQLREELASRERENRELGRKLRNAQNNQNDQLLDILEELRAKNQGSNQNKEILVKVMNKVNELSKQRREHDVGDRTLRKNRSSFSQNNGGQSRLEENRLHEQTSHTNQPQFFNQPNYQTPTPQEGKSAESNMYLKVLIDENNQLKKELKEMSELMLTFKRGIGSKKRRILNEIMSLVQTKNAFDERYISEVSRCPYKIQSTIESRISNSVIN